ncbi:heme peroxidase [Plenodomus tracheiphilus IPT5]|uniref:Peroxidase n=1 Tax=Plenodomus tracheiphilus IPT5 TaxID=1408161 RepID=A0A6A7BIA0_9PLEO|nr:heme peroxidase [Plenodomus tracheiphilus IPT5]
MKWNTITKLALVAPASAAYVWPNTQDSMDDLLFNQAGYSRNGALSDQVQTCDFGARQPGIQKAAEWVRTAFHDAVTHDADTKIGGLDASIQYELDRPENLGDALNNTLADISSSVNIHSSAADLIALAMVMSVARCGDLNVPLRIGRADATVAGIKGVPEAHTDLETSRRRFEMASFNQSEMITLIACGHSIGSVHSVDHPEIVITGEPAPENVAHFDSTFGNLDNGVVTEYLDNSTANPLVRNTNETLNSDKRIFASDGNETMRKLADKDHFKSQCEILLERMINLVPGDVKLSEPMVPSDIKPYIDSYQLVGNGSIEFAGRVRVRISPVTGRDRTSLTSALLPTSRNGNQATEISTDRATWQLGMSFGYLDESFQWFEFNKTLPASQALKSFNIRVDATTYDNAGTGGYPVNPDILFQQRQSCVTWDADTNKGTLTVVAAVSKSLLGNGAIPQMRVIQRIDQERNFIPRLEPEMVKMTRLSKETADYVYYNASTFLGRNGLSTSFDLEVGDSKVKFIQTGGLVGGKECEAL